MSQGVMGVLQHDEDGLYDAGVDLTTVSIIFVRDRTFARWYQSEALAHNDRTWLNENGYPVHCMSMVARAA